MTQPRNFTPDQVSRYARHLILPEVGGAGQRKLLNSSVLLLGAGGLGSPAALYLAAAGVGTLGIVDFDEVDASNLQRQILDGTADVGKPKTQSAAETLQSINPDVKVIEHRLHVNSENALQVFEPYDLIIDGTDNFPTRYLANDAAFFLARPLVHGAIYRFEGQLSTFDAAKGAGCYRCLFPTPPPPGAVPSCAEAGVFGVLPGIVGSMMAFETIKHVLGIGEGLIGKLLIFEGIDMEFRKVNLRRNPACPLCGDEPTVTGLIDYEVFCGAPAVERSEAPAVAGLSRRGAGGRPRPGPDARRPPRGGGDARGRPGGLPAQPPGPLLPLQGGAVRDAGARAPAPGPGPPRLRGHRRRRGRPPAGPRLRRPPRGPLPAAGGRAGQGRDPGRGEGPGAAQLGQALVRLPLLPHPARHRRDAGGAAAHRRRRVGAEAAGPPAGPRPSPRGRGPHRGRAGGHGPAARQAGGRGPGRPRGRLRLRRARPGGVRDW